MFLSSTSSPCCLATLITLPRVMPGRQLSGRGVRTTPSRTMKKLVALVSETKPLLSSMRASSTLALLAWILARMLFSRLLWWILLSRNAGEFLRMLELTSRWGFSPDTRFPDESIGGFHSARTMRHEPAWLLVGLIPLVTLSPLVSVSRMCVSSRMSFALSVSKIACAISSFSGTCSNSRARAESCKRCMCSWKSRILSLYTRSPSHTASPPCTELSKTLTLASSRRFSTPPTCTKMSLLRSSGRMGEGLSCKRASCSYSGIARSASSLSFIESCAMSTNL
mmetsp:Transcript_15864/g.36265  ORF Transcript_15864/g.36265 Transcript_15864/m.36265 type:complete len:281 (+) Transcript_15864:287-1129(+)